MKVLFFGGSFDPPHVAHVLAVSYALLVGDFERVLVVPVFEHAFGKRLTPFADRLKMCELAFEGMQRVQVSAIEEGLSSPSYTLRTLEALHAEQPTWKFSLLVGSDVVSETSKWHGFERVKELASLFVLDRAGQARSSDSPVSGPAERALLPQVSSTEVRALLKRAGEPEASAELERLVPRRVREYAAARKLYSAC